MFSSFQACMTYSAGRTGCPATYNSARSHSLRPLSTDREQFSDHRLTLDPLVPELIIHGPSGSYHIDRQLGSVWFRQPVFLRNTPSVPLSRRNSLERSWTAFQLDFASFVMRPWMNSPTATYIAGVEAISKLAVAAMWLSGSGNAGDQRRTSYPGGVPRHDLLSNQLDTVLLRDGDDCLFTYTTLNPVGNINDETVNAAPLLARSSLNFPVKSPYGSPRSVKLLIPPTCLAGEARCEAPRLS